VEREKGKERKEIMDNMKRRILLPAVLATTTAVLIALVAGCSGFTNMRGNTQYGADERMSKEVVDALKKDPLYKFPNVSVNTYRGQVQLSGYINHADQREAAVKDASGVPGVLNVQDNIMVNTNPPVLPAQ
jgi:hyperosmotically inducible periplasmic protein